MPEKKQEDITMKRFLYIVLMLSALLTGCGAIPGLNPTATFTPVPTNTPEPTLTPAPTSTPTATPTSTPDAAATQAAQATQTAEEVLAELDLYLGEKSEIDYQAGQLLWRQSKPVTINMAGPQEIISEIGSDITTGDFIMKSEVMWEATGLIVCGAIFRSEPNIEEGKQYKFLFLRFSGLPAWAIEVHQYGQFKNSPTDVRFSDAVDMDNGATNQFILVAQGNEFTVYMNRNREGHYFDYSTQRSEGAFAFFASQTGGDGRCVFDNSWIWSLDT